MSDIWQQPGTDLPRQRRHPSPQSKRPDAPPLVPLADHMRLTDPSPASPSLSASSPSASSPSVPAPEGPRTPAPRTSSRALAAGFVPRQRSVGDPPAGGVGDDAAAPGDHPARSRPGPRWALAAVVVVMVVAGLGYAVLSGAIRRPAPSPAALPAPATPPSSAPDRTPGDAREAGSVTTRPRPGATVSTLPTGGPSATAGPGTAGSETGGSGAAGSGGSGSGGSGSGGAGAQEAPGVPSPSGPAGSTRTPVPSAPPGEQAPTPTRDALTATFSRTADVLPLGLGGYQGTVRVSNPGPVDVHGWRVTLTVPGGNPVTPGPGVDAVQHGENVLLRPRRAFATLAAGGAVSMTFTVSGVVAAEPAGCRIDGRPCG